MTFEPVAEFRRNLEVQINERILPNTPGHAHSSRLESRGAYRAHTLSAPRKASRSNFCRVLKKDRSGLESLRQAPPTNPKQYCLGIRPVCRDAT
jgi:hypothetical protein